MDVFGEPFSLFPGCCLGDGRGRARFRLRLARFGIVTPAALGARVSARPPLPGGGRGSHRPRAGLRAAKRGTAGEARAAGEDPAGPGAGTRAGAAQALGSRGGQELDAGPVQGRGTRCAWGGG